MSINNEYLFDKAKENQLTPEDIENILAVFKRTKSKSKGNNQKDNNIVKTLTTGYTYWGQFISHDIVPPTTPSKYPSKRHVTPLLNLDSLYGDTSCHHIFFNAKGSFKKGPTKDDILRDNLGNVIIPEKRNAENLIIFQFHRLWQKVHNAFVKENLRNANENSAFISAKRATIALFQLITIDDYLEQLLDNAVHKHYFCSNKAGILTEQTPFTRVPFEFSHAAFRFGHSMVRSNYRLNCIKDHATGSLTEINKDLSQLLVDTYPAPIDQSTLIGWDSFFNTPSSTCNKSAESAEPIDLHITGAMFDMPHGINIVSANIHASVNKALKSGFDIVKILKGHDNFKCLFIEQDPITVTSRRNLQALKYLYDNEKLPLWLYVLDEASQARKGSLGILGSIIVADVIRQSIYQYHTLSTASSLTYKTYRAHLIKEFYQNCGLSEEKLNKAPFIETTSDQEKFTMSMLLNFMQGE